MSGLQNFFHTFFNWDEIKQTLPQLVPSGIVNTLVLSAGAIVCGVAIGIVLALMLVSRRWFVRLPARVYVDIFRGLPIILTVLVVGQGLPIAGIRIFGRSAYPYAVLALALVSGAYISEIFRSGIQSIEKGQMEAARGLGMPYLTAMRLVIVPQGIRRVLPALTNQFIAMVKDSSLVYLLGLATTQRELFSIARDSSAETGNLSPMVAAGFFYLVITVPLTHVVNHLDRRMREGGKVRPDASASLELAAVGEGR